MIRIAVEEFSDSVSRGRFRLLMAVVTVAIAIFILSGFFFISENINRGMDRFRSSARIDVLLAPAADRIAVNGAILSVPGVSEAKYLAPQEVLRNFEDSMGGEIARGVSEALGRNPFPAMFEVGLAEDVLDPAPVALLIEKIKGVDEVIYGARTAGRWNDLGEKIRASAYLIGAVMSVFTILIVINNVRLSAFSRNHEIYVMRLVGATDFQIAAPFLLEGGVIGLAGSLLGLGGLFAAHVLIAPKSAYLGLAFLSPQATLGIVALGVAVGIFGGYFGVRENLRMIPDDQE